MDALIDQLKRDIERKKTLNQSQQLDDEVLAYIDIYKHSNKLYSALARKWLQFFLVNAGYAKKISDLK